MDASRKHFKESPLGWLRSISKSTCLEREGPGGAAQTLSWRGGAERPGRLKRPSSEVRVPERGVRWGDRTRDKGPMCRHRLTTDQHTHQKKLHETSQRTTLGWSGDASGEEPARQCRRHRNTYSIPGSGRTPGGEHGNPPDILAWRIPWTEKTGGLQSIGVQRVGHDWSNFAHHTQTPELIQPDWTPSQFPDNGQDIRKGLASVATNNEPQTLNTALILLNKS